MDTVEPASVTIVLVRAALIVMVLTIQLAGEFLDCKTVTIIDKEYNRGKRILNL